MSSGASNTQGKNFQAELSTLANIGCDISEKSQNTIVPARSNILPSSKKSRSAPIINKNYQKEDQVIIKSDCHMGGLGPHDQELLKPSVTRRTGKWCAKSMWMPRLGFVMTIVIAALALLLPAQSTVSYSILTTTSATYSPAVTFAIWDNPSALQVHAGTLFTANKNGKLVSRWNLTTNSLIRTYAYLDNLISLLVAGGFWCVDFSGHGEH
jgi:hypothetical protein